MKKEISGARSGAAASPKGVAPTPRAIFSDEFKRQAVERLRLREQSAEQVASELGIRRNQLYKWAKKLEQRPSGECFRSPGRPPVAEESDLLKLRRELSRAQEELAILKKFDAYLTRQGK